MKFNLRWLWPSLLILVVGLKIVEARPATPNLLLNGDFETGDSVIGSDSAYWEPWWLETPKPNDGSLNYAYKPSWNREKLSNGAAAELVFAGDASQRVINNWDPWYAGVRQTVMVTPNATLRLTAYARAWAASGNWPEPSDTSVNVKVRLGIDPEGGADPFGGTVIWSEPIAPHNQWRPITLTAWAGNAGQVTVFLGSDYRGESRLFLATFWDEAVLETVALPPQVYLPLLISEE